MSRQEWATNLLEHAKAGFALDIDGIHGLPHWRRVLEHGIMIAENDPMVDRAVLYAFAVLHDSQRLDENEDPMHGPRAMHYIRSLREQTNILDHLSYDQLRLLEWAVSDHSLGFVTYEPTVQACWDADRLDLGRVGIYPDPAKMGHAYSKRPDVIADAWRQAVAGSIKGDASGIVEDVPE